MMSAAIALGIWLLVIFGVLALGFRIWLRGEREAQRMERLREMGDREWEAGEVELWRSGIDPTGHVDDLTDLEFDQAIESYCDWVNSLPVREPLRYIP